MQVEKIIHIEDYILINYTELSLNKKKELLDIRNNKSVRKWMLDDSKISLSHHLSFIDNLKNDDTKFYYAVFFNESIIGALNIVNWNGRNRECEWGCFLNPKFFGFGMKLGFLFINLIFNYFLPKKIFSIILKENREAIILNKALGFQKLLVFGNKCKYQLNRDFWTEVPNNYNLFLKIITNNYKLSRNGK